MVVVDYTAGQIRDDLTTLALYVSVGSSTTETISITSTTINSVITTVARSSISYPSSKKFTGEFIFGSGVGNGEVFRRIAIKDSSTTSQVISLSNVPELDKNNLIEVVYEVTFEVANE